jgi:isopenicillin-N N-acyltransferase like protein
MKKILVIILAHFFCFAIAHADIVLSQQEGFLEKTDGQQILHLKGSSYEMGFQHGRLMKDQIAHNIARFIDSRFSSPSLPPIIENFLTVIPQVNQHIPQALIDEMQGLADGSEIPYDKILLLNLFPEMFHCSGITVKGQASCNETLYHVRVLDYAAAISLQDTAVLVVAEPQQGNAFINATYAGFIGCVTGMNNQKIAIGEIGGKGYGSWNGLPMAFLLRQILQYASTLEEIKYILNVTPRTCEYYYIFSDGKTKDSIAAYATAKDLVFIYPGTTYFLPPTLPCSQQTPTANECRAMPALYTQPEDTLVLTRGTHFSLLVERLKNSFGRITPSDLKEAIKQPVAHPSNLHNVIFAPETLELWISHASADNAPACDQPYCHFEMSSLLERVQKFRPDLVNTLDR